MVDGQKAQKGRELQLLDVNTSYIFSFYTLTANGHLSPQHSDRLLRFAKRQAAVMHNRHTRPAGAGFRNTLSDVPIQSGHLGLSEQSCRVITQVQMKECRYGHRAERCACRSEPVPQP